MSVQAPLTEAWHWDVSELRARYRMRRRPTKREESHAQSLNDDHDHSGRGGAAGYRFANRCLQRDAPRQSVGYTRVDRYWWHGRRYCWYGAGWHGPGWYVCRYGPWVTGSWWGGGYAWHRWRGGYRVRYGWHWRGGCRVRYSWRERHAAHGGGRHPHGGGRHAHDGGRPHHRGGRHAHGGGRPHHGGGRHAHGGGRPH